MLHSQNSRRVFTTVVVIVALVGITALLFVAAPASSSAAGSPERKHYRISVRGSNRETQAGSDFARRSRVTLNGPMVPVASITVDRTDDTFAASACTAAANDCSLRGAVAFANLNPGTTINVPAGTYNLTISGAGEGFSGDDSIGDLDITADGTTIIGAGAGTTIINQTQSGDRVIEVNPFLDPNFNTSISDVTISGGTENTGAGGGGIVSGSIDNSLTLTNCVISGNSATGAGTFGGGGVSHAGGSLNITGCTFSNNSTSGSGGALGYSAGDLLGRTPSVGTLTISGSTFSTNTANSTAAGGAGADLFDFNSGVGTYNIDSSTFSGNVAPSGSGGAIIVESGGPLTVTTSSFENNHAAFFGGAINGGGSVASVTYSRLVGNSVTVPTNGLTLFRSAGVFSADDNWWGINSGPSANDFQSTSGSIFPTTFLKLQASGSPNTICSGATSNIAANIKQRNVGADLTVELNGLPPFPATFVNATPALGNLSGVSANFVNGSASATFTAGATSGTANIDVTADSQTVTASVVVQTNTTTDPADQTLCEGGTATFSTTASGPGPFTFVWKKGATVLNNGDLGGRVTIVSSSPTSTLSISSVQSSDADTYTVEATGTCSTATQSATLTVNAATSATTPADQTVCQGNSANFSTTAGGTGPFHYAWTVDGSPSGGDTSSISVPTGALSLGNHSVSVTVTGTCGSATKNAMLTVQANTTTSDPPDQTVCQGATAGFSTTASGTGPFHYAWTLDGSPFNGDNPSISVPTGSLSVGNHTVAVTTTGTCGSASQSATLTVQANTTTSDPPDQTVCQGATAGFSTTAGGTGPFHYAWTLDGLPFNGDNPSISVPTTSLSIGNHTVSVTTSGTCGSASQSATLTVRANTTATTPADQTVCQGATAGFSTTASGTGLHYAWTVDGSSFNGDNSSISVPTGSLSVGNHPVSVTVTGTCGSVTKNATLTVQANTTTTHPADQNVCQGATPGFSTTAGGTGPFHYAWTVDGAPSGGDSPSISVPTGSLSIGNHTVAVTTSGACGSASQSATLTVRQNTTTTDPPDRTACVGSTTSFSTVASGTGPFTFVWKKGATVLHNGDLGGRVTIVSSSTISTLTISNIQVGDVGAYNVETTGSCNTFTQSASLAVDTTPPTISCNADIIADFNPAVNGAVVTYTAPVGTDSCSGATTAQIAGLPSGSTFPVGTTTNTFRVTDSTGQTADCSFKVTVAVTSLIGLDSVSITGSGLVDSYDSTIGYPASKGSLANILSNGTITLGGSGKVSGNVRSTRVGVNMSGASRVDGNATAGTTVSLSGSATVGGAITNNALAPVMTLPAVPACGPPYSPNSGISGTYSYNSSTGDLSLSGVNNATLANGNYCFHNVTLSNSAQLKVNGLVVIKMTGTLNTSGATSFTNTTGIPGNLRILSSFSGSNGVTLGNGTNVHAVIYAPTTGVSISGSAPLFGTVAGKTLTIGNSGMIHYDTQLKTIWPAIWTLIFGP